MGPRFGPRCAPSWPRYVGHVVLGLWRATAELMRRANRNYDRMAELEEQLANAKPWQRRTLALLVPGLAGEQLATALSVDARG